MASTMQVSTAQVVHDQIIDDAIAAINDEDSLNKRKKRRYIRRLERPAVAKAVINKVMEEALLTGAVVASGDANTVMVDFDEIMEIVLKYLPTLLKLLLLFL